MQLDQSLLFLRSPLVSLYASFEVVVVSFSTLLSVPTDYVVVGFHESGDLAPFLDSINFIKFLKNIVFLD